MSTHSISKPILYVGSIIHVHQDNAQPQECQAAFVRSIWRDPFGDMLHLAVFKPGYIYGDAYSDPPEMIFPATVKYNDYQSPNAYFSWHWPQDDG